MLDYPLGIGFALGQAAAHAADPAGALRLSLYRWDRRHLPGWLQFAYRPGRGCSILLRFSPVSLLDTKFRIALKFFRDGVFTFYLQPGPVEGSQLDQQR